MEKTILLAVDGSSGAHNAIDYMLGTAEPTHAAVILAYVIEWSPYSFNTPEENVVLFVVPQQNHPHSYTPKSSE